MTRMPNTLTIANHEIEDLPNKMKALLSPNTRDVLKAFRDISPDSMSVRKASEIVCIDYKNVSMKVKLLVELGLLVKGSDFASVYAPKGIKHIVFEGDLPIKTIKITLE